MTEPPEVDLAKMLRDARQELLAAVTRPDLEAECERLRKENEELRKQIGWYGGYPLQHRSIVPKIPGWLTEEEGTLLYRCAANAPGVVVEVGSYEGRSTITMAQTGKLVYAIDPHKLGEPTSWDHFIANLDFYNATNVIPLRMPSTHVHWDMGSPIGLLFIDGEHTYEAVKADYTHFAPYLIPGSFIAFHDYNEVPGIKKYVDELRPNLQDYDYRGDLIVCMKPK